VTLGLGGLLTEEWDRPTVVEVAPMGSTMPPEDTRSALAAHPFV
jgi:hypothetical protein